MFKKNLPDIWVSSNHQVILSPITEEVLYQALILSLPSKKRLIFLKCSPGARQLGMTPMQSGVSLGLCLMWPQNQRYIF